MECYKKHFFDMDKEEQWLNEMADRAISCHRKMKELKHLMKE